MLAPRMSGSAITLLAANILHAARFFARACVLCGILASCDSSPPVDPLTSLPSVSMSLVAGVTLESTPIFSVGGARDQQKGHALHLVRDVILRGDGGVIVATRGSQSLLYYDSIGEFKREAGGPGDGPGEFRTLRSIHRLSSDSVAAWDPGPGRLTIFDTTGEPTGTITWEVASKGSQIRSLRSVLDLYSISSTRFLAVFELIRLSGRPRGLYRDAVYAAVLNRHGEEIASVGRLPGDEWYHVDQTGMVTPFSYRFHTAATSRRIFVGNGRGADLVEYSLAGTPVRRLWLPIERRFITYSEWNEARSRYLARFHEELRPRVAAVFEKAIVVDSFPAFTDLQASVDEKIWIQLYDPPGEPRRWLIVNPDSATARPILLPPNSALLDAARDRIVVLHTDEFDRQNVSVYKIAATKPGGINGR